MTALNQRSRQSLVAGSLESCRKAFLGVGGVSFVINLLMLTGPLFMLQVYDRVLTSRSVPTLVALGLLVIVLYGFFAVLEGLRGRILVRIGQKVNARLTGASFEADVLKPLHPADNTTGEPVRDLETIRQFLSGAGAVAIFDMPWMPIYLGLVFLFHPLLGGIATLGALIIIALIGFNEALSRRPTAALSMLSARRNAFMSLGRENAEVVAAMGMAPALRKRWEQANTAYLDAQTGLADHTGLFGTAIKAFRFLLQSSILGIGAWLAIHQEISPGIMIAASIITSRALAPVEQAVPHWRNFIAARQSLQRLKTALEKYTQTPPETCLPLPGERLELHRLAVAPPGLRIPTVIGVTLTLKAGDGLGIIGPSGSGKSSLARALVGVWPRLGGEMRLDGAEPEQWERARLGGAIGYMPQDVELFEGTVAENITRFDSRGSDGDVIEAARLAQAHDLITRLPQGYDTPVGPRGAQLSAGQRQRIGLARALYGKPFLVVLDEPNSNLDAEGETALTHAVRTMRQLGSIVIVIAHRPSAIAAVDQLLYLEDGRPVACGPKGNVLKKFVAGDDDAPAPFRVVSQSAPKALKGASS